MNSLREIAQAILTVPAYRILAGLFVSSSLAVAIVDRRLVVLPFMLQYILATILVGPQLYGPLVPIRLGIGASVGLMLLLSAERIERAAHPAEIDRGETSGGTMMGRARQSSDMGLLFRLLCAVMAGLVALSLARSWPLVIAPFAVTLGSYWLLCLGMITLLTAGNAYRLAIGLLSSVLGFETILLLLERSLLVVALMGIAHLLIALAAAVLAEREHHLPIEDKPL